MAVLSVPKRTAAPGPSSDPVYDCDSSVQERDFVYIGDGGLLKKARADSINTMPAIGYVFSKLSDNRCIVKKLHLELNLVGIINRKKYYVSETDAGELQDFLPTHPDHVIQHVATGIGEAALDIFVDPTTVVIRS